MGPDLRAGSHGHGRSHHHNECGSYPCHAHYDVGRCYRRRVGNTEHRNTEHSNTEHNNAEHNNTGANHDHRAEHDNAGAEHYRAHTCL
jgi:hypothetical protein